MKKIINILIAMILTSCSTTKGFKGNADFCGMLTDSNNKGIKGYIVCINGNRKCVTNDSGVFIFPNVSSQTIHITGYKNGYEKIDEETFFFDENNFICFTVRSKQEVLKEIEECLLEKEYKKADELITSISYENTEEKLCFLKSLIFYLNNEKKKAMKIISKINFNDENIELYKEILKQKD